MKYRRQCIVCPPSRSNIFGNLELFALPLDSLFLKSSTFFFHSGGFPLMEHFALCSCFKFDQLVFELRLGVDGDIMNKLYSCMFTISNFTLSIVVVTCAVEFHHILCHSLYSCIVFVCTY